MRCQKSSLRAVTSAPATTSLWPFRYLVAECITRSAPRSSGRVSSGVATVLSTASSAPAACASLAAAAMSVIAQVGLAGVSIQSSRVWPGRQGLEQGGRGRHARREGEAGSTALERREQRLGVVEGGIVGARIGAPGAVLVVGVAQEGCGGMNRRDDRLRGRIHPAHRLGGQ